MAKQIKKKQKGRSMIEMLGVLAIIGVLSIVGLFGFNYAMNRHKANETIHDVMIRGTNVPMMDEYYASKPSGYTFTFPDLRDGTYYAMETLKDTGRSYYVDVAAVAPKVCTQVLNLNPTDIDAIVVEGTLFTGNNTGICGNTPVQMRFCFGTDGTVCNGSSHGGGSGSGGSGGTGSGSGSGSGGSGSGTPPCTGPDCGPSGCIGSACCVGSDCGPDGGCTGLDCCVGADCGPDGCTGPDCCTGSDCGPDGCTGPDCCVGSDCGPDGCRGPDCCIGEDCGPGGCPDGGNCCVGDCCNNPSLPECVCDCDADPVGCYAQNGTYTKICAYGKTKECPVWEDRTSTKVSGNCCDGMPQNCCPITEDCTCTPTQDCPCDDPKQQRAPDGTCIDCETPMNGADYGICVPTTGPSAGEYRCCCFGGGNWNQCTDGSGHCVECVPPKVFDGGCGCQCAHQTCTGDGDPWCCGKDETCGTTQGQCCVGAVCCKEGETAYNDGWDWICCKTGEWVEIFSEYWYYGGQWVLDQQGFGCRICPKEEQQLLCEYREDGSSKVKECSCCPNDRVGYTVCENGVPYEG